MKNLLAELLADPWAMEPRALEAFLEKVRLAPPLPARHIDLSKANSYEITRDFTNMRSTIVVDADPKAFFGDEAPPKRKGMTIAGGVARIPVSGTLLKRVPGWMRWFGFDVTGYADIEEDVKAAAGDETVKEICLVISSPGGQVAGVHEAAEAIAAARGKKTVTAEVQDLCASAAYWLASQASKISAGPNAQVGSIGVYSVYVDSSKAAEDEGFKVHVVSSGPHKGAGVPGAKITPEQLAGFQAVIDGMAKNFKDAVERGRGRARKDVDEWATGQVWLAAEARAMGLIDQVTTTNARNEGSAGVRPAAEHTNPESQEESMPDPKVLEDERKRVADIKAAFPRHPQFALEHIEKGSSLLEAKAAYNAVLEQETADARKAVADAEQKAKVKPSAGADPVGGGVKPDAVPAGKDFMAHAREERAEHVKTCIARMNHKGDAQPECCSMTSAMSRLSAAQPELHKAFVEKTAPKVEERKKALGIK
jgi:signal peptide peptidase SppA